MSLGITAVGRPWPGAGRLLRIELRRSAMLWLLPLAAALFYYQAYRRALALPPLWSLRAMTLQNDALLDFAMPVAGGAAWVGARESRRHLADLVAGTARSRWARQLAAWAAVTCWALAGYLACTGVVYAITARQATWGGPLWWPVAVDAAGVSVISAAGFAAGALLPSRFTAPLAAVAAFFALGFSIEAAHGSSSYWLIAPGTAVGPSAGVATFYGFLPDLSIAQVMFLTGLAGAVLGGLGLPVRAAGRRLRAAAVALTVAGLATAGTAVGLVGTARFDSHGMTVIPALHDAASGAPVPYTPVCTAGPVPVCLHPAYAADLPAVSGALRGVLSQVAGLPGAPSRVAQAAPLYTLNPPNGVSVRTTSASGGTALLLLPVPPPGQTVNGATVTPAEFAAQAAANIAPGIVAGVIGGRGRLSPAQAVVTAALLMDGRAGLATPEYSIGGSGQGVTGRPPTGVTGQPPAGVAAAFRRFAALPAAARHAWLAAHLAALRAGRVSLAQLP
ncbi:MAG TPA: hypothetical protein VK586_01390 [Streptosporangiaceae bacterium]|nr:hypothetical protein [Streptosporangiaceae bacterium]